jgi:hypothetical protein
MKTEYVGTKFVSLKNKEEQRYGNRVLSEYWNST